MRYVRSSFVEIESHRGDEVVMLHALLGNRLRLSRGAAAFLGSFDQPRSLDELAGRGTPDGIRACFDRLRSAGFLVEEGYRETIEDKRLQRPQNGFLGCPIRRSGEGCADVTFLGVPFDGGNPRGPGARYAPAALRRLSLSNFRHYRIDPETDRPKPWYDNDLDREILGGVRLDDAGEVFVAPNESASSVFRKVRQVVAEIAGDGSFPVVLGGDHSITLPVLEGFDRPLRILHLDAHSDLAEFREGAEHHHGNVITRALGLPHILGVHQIGIRGTTHTRQTAAAGKVAGVCTPRQLRTAGLEAALATLPADGDYYLSLDIDLLDPTVAPGTSTPVPGGLGFEEAKQLLATLTAQRNVVGMDLVEVNPDRDRADATAMVAIELLLAALGGRFARGRAS